MYLILSSAKNLLCPKINPTKMGSDDVDWKQKAYDLFYKNGLSIIEISEQIGVSRKSVGQYLKSMPDYLIEREKRKQDNKILRQEYQREWDRYFRQTHTPVNDMEYELIKRQHIIDVNVLSHERFF